jgi:hypothetical protein
MLRNGMFRQQRGRAGPCCYEDLELGYRLHAHGLQIRYATEALGQHYHVATFDQVIERQYQIGLNYGDFLSLVPDPEAPVFRHVLNSRTWRAHLKTLRSRNTLSGSERYMVWHLGFHLVRLVCLNRWAVDWFWKPLLEAAEASDFLAKRVRPYMYRGVLYHYFLRGVKDGHRRYDRPMNRHESVAALRPSDGSETQSDGLRPYL